jgi:RecA/RadA recombinase
MVNNNSDGTAAHRLLSDLPLSIFENLISTPRAVHHHDDDDAVSSRLLRQQILSKLSTEVNNDKSTHPAALSPPLTSSSSSSSSITVRQLLKISELGLLRILDPLLTIIECRTLLKRVHNVCSAQSHSALQQLVTNTSCSMRNGNNNRQYYNSYKIPTGLSSIDNYLHGGFAPGTITEVVGRAGVGKTHLAQQLCVLAASLSSAAAAAFTAAGGDVSPTSGCGGGGSIFIDTENKLSLDRLNEITINQCRKQETSSSTNNNYYSSNSSSGSRMNPVNFAQNVLENVTIRSLLSTKELLETLDELELEITERNNEASGSGGSSSGSRQRLPVRLLVIDSIAAPIRRDFDMMMTSSSLSSSSSIAAQRAAAIFQIARKLKELASNFNLAVVVINQVGAGGGGVGSNIYSSNQHQRNDTLDIRDGEFTASLGTAWQYCVSTRIILEHDDDPHMQGRHYHRDTRTVTIAKSLLSRRAKVEFQVTDEGLCEVFS